MHTPICVPPTSLPGSVASASEPPTHTKLDTLFLRLKGGVWSLGSCSA